MSDELSMYMIEHVSEHFLWRNDKMRHFPYCEFKVHLWKLE